MFIFIITINQWYQKDVGLVGLVSLIFKFLEGQRFLKMRILSLDPEVVFLFRTKIDGGEYF